MSAASHEIVFHEVSKFYGDVLGINGVDLSIGPGITSLVGPNGAGKTTLLNLMTGLIQPSRGSIQVLGISTGSPQRLFRCLGYSTQYDAFPPGFTGLRFIQSFLSIHGYGRGESERMAWRALEHVGLVEAARQRIATYSKGMRQRVKLAQAMAHEPRVLVLDEPLNGLDPMARTSLIDLFKVLASRGAYLIISSHVLDEVDMISDQVILINGGYLVAEGDISSVREEIEEEPAAILVRCSRPEILAARVFGENHAVEVRLHSDRRGLVVRTRDPEALYLLLNRVVLDEGLEVDTVEPADADVVSLYQYLISSPGGMS